MLRRTMTTALTIGLLWACATTGRAAIVPFDLSSAFNYDMVGTSNETTANSGNLSSTTSGLGDHNYLNNHAYTNQGSVVDGTALPDNGQLGIYQLGPYDNGTDYLTKSNNAIAFRTWQDNNENIITHTVSLPAGQQNPYSGINLAFVNRKQSHGSTSYRTWIEVAYTDSTTEIIIDTGLTGSGGGSFGAGGLSSQGGLYNLTDTYSFVDTVTGNTYAPQLLLGMDRRLNGGTVGSGTAAIWELDQFIPVDSTKVLESVTIGFRGPWSNANRTQQFYVLAVSGELVPEPASLALVGLGGLMLLGRRGRKC